MDFSIIWVKIDSNCLATVGSADLESFCAADRKPANADMSV